MSKKEEATKLTAEELQGLQGMVGAINNAQMTIGGLEAQKADALKQMDMMRAQLDELRAELEEKYGNVQIDINTGEISEGGSDNQED